MKINHVVVGNVDESIMEKIISLRSDDPNPSVLRVSGQQGDGKKILELIATSDKVVYWN